MTLEAAISDAVRSAVLEAMELHQTAAGIQREALSISEAADAVGVSPETMRRLVDSGEVPARRTANGGGRVLIPLQGLRQWLAGA